MAAGGGIVRGNCTQLTGIVDECIAIGVEPEFAIGRQGAIAFPVKCGRSFGLSGQHQTS